MNIPLTNRSLVAALLLSVALSACTEPTTRPVPDPTPPSGSVPGTTQGYITGRAVNEQGVALPGVEVVADNTMAYDSNEIAVTDAQGHYRIDVRNAPFTFNVTATKTLQYQGAAIRVDLMPDTPEIVPGGVGGVRNFTFKPKPPTQADPYGSLGCVFVEREAGHFEVDPAQVTLTLTPVGTLADGTTGHVRTTRLVMSGSGWVAANVMWGTYTVTASMNGQPLEVRRRIGGMETYEWGASYTGGFTRDYNAIRPNMYLELRTPRP
ncbi:carboxypeptidase-like regulatory domain-containing protein [Deinococcus sonorensis]|uniref:Carboxypeptidase regulatory-like domain-containing protein n=1 Tax=Deinococcus sonorensis KR-87 TaxID=694439 RepID=A0AAU7U5M0_9DEIO